MPYFLSWPCIYEEPGWPDIHVEPGKVQGLLALISHGDRETGPQKGKAEVEKGRNDTEVGMLSKACQGYLARDSVEGR